MKTAYWIKYSSTVSMGNPKWINFARWISSYWNNRITFEERENYSEELSLIVEYSPMRNGNFSLIFVKFYEKIVSIIQFCPFEKLERTRNQYWDRFIIMNHRVKHDDVCLPYSRISITDGQLNFGQFKICNLKKCEELKIEKH